jgi:peroxiredoxin
MSSQKQSLKIGDPAPDLALLNLKGELVRLSEFRGKRALLFVWASWCISRQQLSGWQDFYAHHQGANFEIIGIALDPLGAAVARPYLEQGGAEFVNLLDPCGSSWDLFGFNMTPSGFYVDETGRVRYLKTNSFNIGDPTTVKILQDLLEEKWSKKAPKPSEKSAFSLKQELAELSRQIKTPSRNPDKRFRLVELLIQMGQLRRAGKEAEALIAQSPKNIRALYCRGLIYLLEKRPDWAATCWRQANQLDPAHWVIRKQLWSLENPEQFYPEINFEWQQEQLHLEEIQEGVKPKAKAQKR